MKVGVNARILSAPSLRGWNRYTLNLLTELPALGVQVIVYSDQALHASHLKRLPADAYTLRVAPTMPYALWEQRWLPTQCGADRVDVLHTPFHFGVPFFSSCRRVLTLHDAIDHAQRARSLGARFNIRVQLTNFYRWVARARAHHVITVSEYSKSELVKHYGFTPTRLTVTPEAADARFRETVTSAERDRIRAKYGLNATYVWYVGGYEERKNVSFLIRAFAEADLPDTELVLAGGTTTHQGTLEDLARSIKVADRVRFLGVVDDADLPGLYAEALCFVYPSRQEGFGLQLCEAMATGCPTLASRATSLPEVLGTGGETFTLNDTKELRDLLVRLATDPSFRDELSSRATHRSADFSWRQTAVQTVQVYQRAVSGP